MYEDSNFENLVLEAQALENQTNRLREAIYLQRCSNWAQNHGNGPAPVAPMKKIITAVQADYSLLEQDSTEPVSTFNPTSLLPVYGTDINAVGGDVGGPIPGQTNRFYIKSTGTSVAPGDITVVGGKAYRHVQAGFGGMQHFFEAAS